MKKTILLFVVFLMAGGFLGAQDGGFTPEELALASASTDPPMELSVPEGSTGSPYWYGTTGRFWISGSAAGNCQPTSSTLTWSQNFGYYNGSSGSTTFWNCALQAPTGALIGGFEVTTQDSDATDDICAYFWRFPVKSTTATVVGDGCTSGTGDTSIWVVGLDETIENHWHHYLVRVVLNSGTSTNRFRGIFFSTNRQISPAPGSPCFRFRPTRGLEGSCAALRGWSRRPVGRPALRTWRSAGFPESSAARSPRPVRPAACRTWSR